MANILDPQEAYVVQYPVAVEAAETQSNIFWLPDEIDVSKDVQDLLVNMTEAEREAVKFILRLFTLYEVNIGEEYWQHIVSKNFQRPEIQRMAATFSYFELGVHAPFYDKLNKELGLSTEEFYLSYREDPLLSARMDALSDVSKLVEEVEDLSRGHRDCFVAALSVSIGVFSAVEGAVLYSSFAFLKHFQENGQNLLNNVVAGINFSVRDENIHAQAGAWLFRTLMDECVPDNLEGVIKEHLTRGYRVLREQEHQIVDRMFSFGDIEGVDAQSMKAFVDSRFNLCFRNLGFEEDLFPVENNPIADWFYQGINSVILHDFFYKTGNSYHRNWDRKKFTW